MGFCLSHISALEYWRSLDACDAGNLLKTGATARKAVPSPAESGIVSASGIDDDILSTAGLLSHPIHISVPSKDCRRKSDSLIFHVRQNPVPRGSLYSLSRNGFVVSPELTFLQCFSFESLFGLMLIGAELAGSYSLVSRDELSFRGFSGFVRRDPLTSVAKMQAFLQKVPGDNGLRVARRALRYIPERCASPMESVLALLLSLPRSLGGYGLPKPCANFRIPMRCNDRRAAGKSYYVCDLYWPDANLCVEYDSTMFHTGSKRISEDSARRNALAFRGVSVVALTAGQVFNLAELDKAAYLLAKILGVRLSLSSPDFKSRQKALRSALLPGRFDALNGR